MQQPLHAHPLRAENSVPGGLGLRKQSSVGIKQEDTFDTTPRKALGQGRHARALGDITNSARKAEQSGKSIKTPLTKPAAISFTPIQKSSSISQIKPKAKARPELDFTADVEQCFDTQFPEPEYRPPDELNFTKNIIGKLRQAHVPVQAGLSPAILKAMEYQEPDLLEKEIPLPFDMTDELGGVEEDLDMAGLLDLSVESLEDVGIDVSDVLEDGM